MIKRKYGDRLDWSRVIQRKYSQSFIDTTIFKGHITLLHTIKVTEPLFVNYGEKSLCIVDYGFMWLQQFPEGRNHSVTTMFDTDGKIIQWYIDICQCNGFEKGRPWMDDLFLDIIVLPSGEVIEKDADELEEAFSKGVIDQFYYSLARNEAIRLKQLIKQGKFELINLSYTHRNILVALLK